MTTESPLINLLRQHGLAAGESSALLDTSGRNLSYSGLLRASEIFHSQIETFGILPTDCVAVAMPDGLELAFALVAISTYCAVAPINPRLQQAEFDFYLRDLRPRAALVLGGSDSHVMEQAARALDIPVFAMSLDEECLPRLLPVSPGQAPARSMPVSTALVLHTSGTTGNPKMVALTQTDLARGALLIADVLTLTRSDRCLSIMPLFHIHGILVCIFSSIAAGASIACSPGFSAVNFFGWMKAHRPTWFSAVPTMHKLIIDLAEQNPEALRDHSVRFIRSGSSSLPLTLFESMERVFGVPVIESYGMTEATPITYNLQPPGLRKPGTVGVAVGVDMKIVDEAGRELPSGETGEVAIRGSHVIRGYLDDPADADGRFHDGWFRTGDQGHIDADGYLTIAGRLRELINRGGEKVLPKEVEEVLLQHNAVSEVAVFGVPHETLGEDVFAVVVAKGAVAESELAGFVAGRLSRFKVPRRILTVAAIPKGHTGKVQRTMLYRQLKAEIDAMPPPAGASAEEVGRLIVDGLNSLSAVFVDSDGLMRNLESDTDASFEELGLDSLAVMELAIFLGDKTGIHLTEEEILAHHSLQRLIAYVKGKLP